MTARFKFLAGEHIGAALELPDGSFLLGSSPECDLQTGSGDKACALLITVQEGQVTVQLQQGTARLSGTALGRSSVPWPEGGILSFGLTALILGDQVDPGRLDLAQLGLVQAAPEAAAAAATTETQPTPLAAEEEEHPEDDEEAPHRRGPMLFILLVCGLVILGFLLSSLLAGSYLYGRRAEERQLLVQAQEYCDSAGYGSVQAELSDGSLVFSGSLPNQSDLVNFINGLPPFPCGAVFKIELEDSLEFALKRAFAVHGAAVQAYYNQARGVVSLSGYVKDPYVENLLLKAVLPNFAAMPELELKFHYAEELSALMAEKADAAKLPLEFVYGDTALFYSGDLTYEQTRSFVRLQHEVESELNCPLIFADAARQDPALLSEVFEPNAITVLVLPRQTFGAPQATPAPAAPPAAAAESPAASAASSGAEQRSPSRAAVPPRPAAERRAENPTAAFNPKEVVGVTMEPLRFISLKDGRRFFEGALLPSGAVLREITIDYLVVQYHGREIRYELN